MATKFTTEKYAAIKLDTSNLAGPVYPVERQHKGGGGRETDTLDQMFKESLNQSPARPLHMT